MAAFINFVAVISSNPKILSQKSYKFLIDLFLRIKKSFVFTYPVTKLSLSFLSKYMFFAHQKFTLSEIEDSHKDGMEMLIAIINVVHWNIWT